jgi:hypothetical protein
MAAFLFVIFPGVQKVEIERAWCARLFYSRLCEARGAFRR